jgi:UDP-N-acetylmuramate--alanine ligase
MSAIAQYLKAAGHHIAGADRQFIPGHHNESRQSLETEGIKCFAQGEGGLTNSYNRVVVSTAIEDTVPEVQEAKRLGLEIIKRSELLAEIIQTRKTIAIGGTSGKSTTTAMLYEILHHAGLKPSVIGGAGLTRLIQEGKIGNAAYDSGEWLIVEADESDGSIVQYHPEIGVLLNIDKDHQDMPELIRIFGIFKAHSKSFIVNMGNPPAAALSAGNAFDFDGSDHADVLIHAEGFQQKEATILFDVLGHSFLIHTPGRHNMENALAAIAVARKIGISWEICTAALKSYQGIYRRHQVYGTKNGITLIDDFAHNPVKCARSIEACQPFASRLIAWFQPHGYGPTRFLRHDFVDEFAKVIRPGDQIWMSEIYYAGGTAVKDISAGDLIRDLRERGIDAHFVSNRNDLVQQLRPYLSASTTLLLMGARDPSLGDFAEQVWDELS